MLPWGEKMPFDGRAARLGRDARAEGRTATSFPEPITPHLEPPWWQAEEESGVRRRPKSRRPLVVIAHPRTERRAWLTRNLSLDSYHVAAVPDGESLVLQLEQWMLQGERASLVVLARSMPVWQGDEIARSLRASDWNLPSVLVLEPGEAALRDADLGADAVFVWPCDPDDLRTAAMNLVARGPRRRMAVS